MVRFLRHSRGFTLLELLVVISIVGILIAMGVVAFTTAQVSARDSRRRADIKAWQDALEQTYAVSTDYTGESGNGCQDSVDDHMNGITPVDPQGSSYSSTCAATTYCLCAELERANGNSSDANCTYVAGNTSAYYCLSNLQ